MKCPYNNPTIQECNSCPFDDCVRALTADNAIYSKRWAEKNPERVREYSRVKREKQSPEKKQAELQRLIEWKRSNASRVRSSVKAGGERWRKAHREDERERNRLNYLKRKAERVS